MMLGNIYHPKSRIGYHPGKAHSKPSKVTYQLVEELLERPLPLHDMTEKQVQHLLELLHTRRAEARVELDSRGPGAIDELVQKAALAMAKKGVLLTSSTLSKAASVTQKRAATVLRRMRVHGLLKHNGWMRGFTLA